MVDDKKLTALQIQVQKLESQQKESASDIAVLRKELSVCTEDCLAHGKAISALQDRLRVFSEMIEDARYKN